MTKHLVVLVTCANAKEAQRIARAAVQARLAACVNVLGAPVRSVFRWQGRVEQAKEVLLVMKTTRKKLGALQEEVAKRHSYDVPEFIALSIAAGSREYLTWVEESCAPAKSGKRRKK